jgi:hypothetical protein
VDFAVISDHSVNARETNRSSRGKRVGNFSQNDKGNREWSSSRHRDSDHPRLSPAQRLTIAREFGMDDGTTIVRVRRALLFYLLDEMRLLAAVRRLDEDLADVAVWIKDARRIASELTSMESES